MNIFKIMIQTSRLKLRKFILEDAEPLSKIFSDPETMQFYASTKDYKETVKWIEWNLQNYDQFGFGLWAVILKSEDRFNR